MYNAAKQTYNTECDAITTEAMILHDIVIMLRTFTKGRYQKVKRHSTCNYYSICFGMDISM